VSKTTLPANIESLEEFIQSVSSLAEKLQFSQKIIQKIQLAVEEALVNIFHYAYPEGTGEVTITCSLDDKKRFVIEIEDAGSPFNVLSVTAPDTQSDISDRPIGGLGIFLIKKMMEDVQYRREDGKNILTLTINRE